MKDNIKWININDKQPKEEVLAIGYQNEMIVGYIHQENGIWICDGSDCQVEEVTHWISLKSLKKLPRDC